MLNFGSNLFSLPIQGSLGVLAISARNGGSSHTQWSANVGGGWNHLLGFMYLNTQPVETTFPYSGHRVPQPRHEDPTLSSYIAFTAIPQRHQHKENADLGNSLKGEQKCRGHCERRIHLTSLIFTNLDIYLSVSPFESWMTSQPLKAVSAWDQAINLATSNTVRGMGAANLIHFNEVYNTGYILSLHSRLHWLSGGNISLVLFFAFLPSTFSNLSSTMQ